MLKYYSILDVFCNLYPFSVYVYLGPIKFPKFVFVFSMSFQKMSASRYCLMSSRCFCFLSSVHFLPVRTLGFPWAISFVLSALRSCTLPHVVPISFKSLSTSMNYAPLVRFSKKYVNILFENLSIYLK